MDISVVLIDSDFNNGNNKFTSFNWWIPQINAAPTSLIRITLPWPLPLKTASQPSYTGLCHTVAQPQTLSRVYSESLLPYNWKRLNLTLKLEWAVKWKYTNWSKDIVAYMTFLIFDSCHAYWNIRCPLLLYLFFQFY